MKKFVLFSVALMLFSGLFAQRGRLRMAYIDMEVILDSLPEYNRALQELDTRVQNWKVKMDQMTAEIAALKKELEAEKLMLTEDILKEKKEIIAFKEQQLEKFRMEKFGPNGDLAMQKMMILKPIQDRVFNAVQKIVQTRHYDVVFDKSASGAGIIHISKKMDITPLVLKVLRKEKIKEERKKKARERRKKTRKKKSPRESIREKYEARKKRLQAEREAREREAKEKDKNQPEEEKNNK